jgi:hypothetical protein
MVWLFVALAAFSLFAAMAMIDKFLLSGKIGDPRIYAFYVGILSSAALALLPFGFWSHPAPAVFAWAFLAGAAQIYGNFFYFSALKVLPGGGVVGVWWGWGGGGGGGGGRWCADCRVIIFFDGRGFRRRGGFEPKGNGGIFFADTGRLDDNGARNFN